MTSALDAYNIPTTLLAAVNVCIAAIGQTPVAGLDTPNTNALTALRRIGEASIETQEEGWEFNTDEDFPIDPTPGGDIVLPSNTLSAAVHQVSGKTLVQRGMKIYDRKNHTFNIGQTVQVDLVSTLDFEDLPPAARWYITCKAARRFAAGRAPSGTTYQFTKQDENDARVRMEQEDDRIAQHNMQMNPHISFMRRRS